MSNRRRFGRVRKLPSGRWQARYTTPDGHDHTGIMTFPYKRDAEQYLARIETDLGRGVWLDPSSGRTRLADYAAAWLGRRPKPLRPRTRELYQSQLRLHILPTLGSVELGKITPSTVRTWHAGLLAAGTPGPVTVAKCYRLLRAILATAVEDEMLVRNPCVIRGAGLENSPERKTATIAEVYAVAEAIDARFRALVLLATFTGLRWGELVALRRTRLDLLHRTVNVVEQFVEMDDGSLHVGPPKTDAGRRVVSIPDVILADLEVHLATYARTERDALLFSGAKGAPLHRRNFAPKWRAAVRAAGAEHLRFHDLRHTGNTLAAATGASTKELMARMGHASMRAAMLYQHATPDRDAEIARLLSDRVATARAGSRVDPPKAVMPLLVTAGDRSNGHAGGTRLSVRTTPSRVAGR